MSSGRCCLRQLQEDAFHLLSATYHQTYISSIKSTHCQDVRSTTTASVANVKPMPRSLCTFIGCWYALVSANLE
ncbi:unnamed protein product [Lota lota]